MIVVGRRSALGWIPASREEVCLDLGYRLSTSFFGSGPIGPHRVEAVTYMSVGRGKWSTSCGVLLSVAALLSAAPASADPTGDAFLGALSKNGIVMNDGNAAISMARTVCAGFDKNPSSGVMAMKVMKEANLTLKQSGFFVGASISAYCPQWKGKTDDSFDWLNPRPPQM
jgi:hypothetical protein